MNTTRAHGQSGTPKPCYPRAYYWRVRAGQAWAIIFLTGLGLATGYVACKAVFGPVGGVGLAAFLTAFFLFCLFLLSGNVRGRHGVVYLVPYFQRKVGGPETFLRGADLARNAGYLDEMARQAGLRPISAFGYRDHYLWFSFPIPIYHDPAAGLATVSGLLDILRRNPGPVDPAPAVISDLETIEAKLEIAARVGIRFCFHLRMHDEAISPIEFENRSGSYT